jgi:hypothetical protein
MCALMLGGVVIDGRLVGFVRGPQGLFCTSARPPIVQPYQCLAYL